MVGKKTRPPSQTSRSSTDRRRLPGMKLPGENRENRGLCLKQSNEETEESKTIFQQLHLYLVTIQILFKTFVLPPAKLIEFS